MKTITLDILNDKVLKLLKDLESLNLIRLKKDKHSKGNSTDLVDKYNGAMTHQPLREVDNQLNDLRNEWS